MSQRQIQTDYSYFPWLSSFQQEEQLSEFNSHGAFAMQITPEYRQNTVKFDKLVWYCFTHWTQKWKSQQASQQEKNFSDCTFVKVKVTANNVLFGSFVTAEISSHDNVYCIKPLSVVPLQKVFFWTIQSFTSPLLSALKSHIQCYKSAFLNISGSKIFTFSLMGEVRSQLGLWESGLCTWSNITWMKPGNLHYPQG